jgi:hypothetical protein
MFPLHEIASVTSSKTHRTPGLMSTTITPSPVAKPVAQRRNGPPYKPKPNRSPRTSAAAPFSSWHVISRSVRVSPLPSGTSATFDEHGPGGPTLEDAGSDKKPHRWTDKDLYPHDPTAADVHQDTIGDC